MEHNNSNTMFPGHYSLFLALQELVCFFHAEKRLCQHGFVVCLLLTECFGTDEIHLMPSLLCHCIAYRTWQFWVLTFVCVCVCVRVCVCVWPTIVNNSM